MLRPMLIVCVMFLCAFAHAQTLKPSTSKLTEKAPPRLLPAKRSTQVIKIDGLLHDSAWKEAPLATDYVEFRPAVGVKEAEETKTISYLLYSDKGIYFAGFCYERNRDSIARELKGRDGFGMNDYIGIIFDTYKDNLNGFEYFVTPLNEQWDAKMAPNSNGDGEDFSWNAVWKSAVVMHDNGWSFEMFIPYGAIRFGKKEVQDWGVNMTRRRQKTGQQFTWNPIDPNVNGFLTQEGFWTGITNIKPPVRLQFSPYFSVYANHFPVNKQGAKNFTNQVNGGLDVKYGLNQAFTLDLTLIPDFGQVQSDNQVLNLSPFEVRFNENRNFFTEGTELFSKGGLFYSRRIGGTPLHYWDVQDSARLNGTDTLLKNPAESKLINASKISGRTQNGLGIGILNALTRTQYATFENINTKEQRKVVTNPLTNYNVIVLNQSMKNNSSVSLINTNVTRSGADYDANVTAALVDLNDKKNTWNVGGKFALSQLLGYGKDAKNINGYSHNIYFGKTSGRFNFNVWQELTDTKYSHADLGYFTNNNFLDHGAWIGYKWIEPKNWYNRIFLNLNGRVSKLFTPFTGIKETYQTGNVNFNAEIQTKKLWWVGTFLGYTSKQNDFYEPRKTGLFFTRNQSFALGGSVNSNEAKKYSFWSEIFARRHVNFYDQFGVDATVNQTFRFNSKFSVSHRIGYLPRFNNMGYASKVDNGAVFARRKVNTIENIVNLKYSFTNMMWITYRMRHYVSTVDNREFFKLQPTGKLESLNGFAGNVNQNLNLFNIDMVYTWQFAPGSFLNIVWKNSIQHFNRSVEPDYLKNFSNTIDADANNNLSLKVIYFLDYLNIKKWGKKK